MSLTKLHLPKALPYLFLTEMWERFGFYVIQGLLILYLTKYFGFSDDASFSLLGVFTALAYLSPLIGGMLADKYLGYKTSVIWGGLFLMLGYLLLAFSTSTYLFYFSLATIIVGNGLFKPNISSLLGKQYSSSDPNRDTGFTIFYIGINIGALLAGFSSGYIQDYFGWHASFALAALGLLIGLCVFRAGFKSMQNAQAATEYSAKSSQRIFLCCLLAIIALNFLLKIHSLATWLLPCAGIGILVYLSWIAAKENASDRSKIILLVALIISSIVFWMLFLQLFFSANLYADRLVDKHFLGFSLTTTVYYASESVFIILLGPLFAWGWELLNRYDKNPSPFIKFFFGLLFTGVGFLVLTLSTYFLNTQQLVSPLWIFAAYFFITIGELLISPIGLSTVTLLAPANLVGLLMGVWFVATGFGGIFAGWVAKLSSIPASAQTTSQKLIIYQHAFLDFALIAFAAAVVLLILLKVVQYFRIDTDVLVEGSR